MQMRNATAAVIGAGDYIGAAIARKFAAEGFITFVGRRDGDKLAPLSQTSKRTEGAQSHANSTHAKKTK